MGSEGAARTQRDAPLPSLSPWWSCSLSREGLPRPLEGNFLDGASSYETKLLAVGLLAPRRKGDILSIFFLKIPKTCQPYLPSYRWDSRSQRWAQLGLVHTALEGRSCQELLSVTCHPSPRGTKWENRKDEGSVLLERHRPSHAEGLGEASVQESRVPSAGRGLQTRAPPAPGPLAAPKQFFPRGL